MTGKEIIIDGVNVAECEYFGATMDKSHNCSKMGDEYLCSCEGGTKCYYKQLKRKEEECEKLKKEILHQADEILMLSCDNEQLDQLKAENEHLRVDATRVKMKAKKFLGVLQEIKEIVTSCHYGDCSECKNKLRDDCRTEIFCKILQKCEVLDE